MTQVVKAERKVKTRKLFSIIFTRSEYLFHKRVEFGLKKEKFCLRNLMFLFFIEALFLIEIKGNLEKFFQEILGDKDRKYRHPSTSPKKFFELKRELRIFFLCRNLQLAP